MIKIHTYFVAIATLLCVSHTSFAQTEPDLGAASAFSLFTAVGGVTNQGTSVVTGNVGTGAGAFNGFPPGVIVGETHVADAIAGQAATDVTSAYADLLANPCGSTVLSTSMGNGQVLTPGVYCLGAAATITGNLILNGLEDPNAVFIFKINGALATADLSSVLLINGTSLNHVYWQINGQFDIGSNAIFRGTAITNGAINLLESASLFGRGLSVAGAINLQSNIVVNTPGALPVTLTKFMVKKDEGRTALIAWATTEEANSDRFEIERSMDGRAWQLVASLNAKGESNVLAEYVYTDKMPEAGINLYRLKMIDRDNSFAYSTIRSIEFEAGLRAALYPNPVFNQLTLDTDNTGGIDRLQLINMNGKIVYEQVRTASSKLLTSFDVSFLSPGLYVGRITGKGGTRYQKILKVN